MVVLLLPDALLSENLDGAIARAMHADVRPLEQPVADFEADLRAAVEFEEIVEHVAPAASERAQKPVRHAKRKLPVRHPERRRQGHEVEVRLERIESDIRIRRN